MAEFMEDEVQEKSNRKRKILLTILHVIFHIILISYFIGASLRYFTFDRNSSKCIEPISENQTTPAEPTVPPTPQERYGRQVEDTTTEIPTTKTTQMPEDLAEDLKKKPFVPHILCDINLCTGYGFLVILIVIFYTFWIYYWLFKPYLGQKLYDEKIDPVVDHWIKFSRGFAVSLIMLLIVLVVVIAYLLFECRDDFRKMTGILGPTVFIFLGFTFSKNRKEIPWRIVVHGILGQLLLGILCIRLEFGRHIFRCIGDKVTTFLQYANNGARFVYGDRICDDLVFAFAILAVIFFFSVVSSCLYYLGTMQFILSIFGWLLQATVGTTVCESINAVGNVFLGMSESPLLIRPYISILTISELHTICVSGYSTVAGTVLGAYIAFGASAAYLITASVMAAPASLAFAKLFYPETEESQTRSENIQIEKSTDTSLLDAVISGAAAGLAIVLGIVSNIIAFLALFAFLDAVTQWIFELIGFDGITLVYLLTLLVIPLVFLMGVPMHDCYNIGRVVAEKTFINEFKGYQSLGKLILEKTVEQRSAGIATFALCGFANPGSLGILIAALSAMAPNRRPEIVNAALRAFFVGSIVSFTSASFAGILIQESELEHLGKRMADFQFLSFDNIGHYVSSL